MPVGHCVYADAAIMTNCAACRKEFKRSKGQKLVSCIYCKSEFHRTCNTDFIVNKENETEVHVICRPCVIEKINKGSEESKRANELENSIAVLTKQVEDLTAKLNELCKSNPPNIPDTNNSSTPPDTNGPSNPNFSIDFLETKILEALQEQKQQEKRKLNVFIRGMKISDNDKTRFAQICVSELHLTEAEANDIKMTKRVGLASENSPQPLLVTLNSAHIRRKILKNAPNLRHYSEERIFIAPDFTKKQLEANKVVFSEYKLRKSRGENVKILRNKVVQILPPLSSSPHQSPPSFLSASSTSIPLE